MSLSPESILDALRPVQDPDLRRSIVDLGFIKNIKIAGGEVAFDLELTTPACPVKDDLKRQCEERVGALPGAAKVTVNMTAQTRAPQTMPARQILKTVKNIIAVASGKGGVGKSTTAANLAAALRATGASVGILDADIYGPSIPTMVRIEKPPEPVEGNRIIPAEGHGLKIISMAFFMPRERAAILRGPMVSGYVSQFLGNVEWGELDYLLIDYPPGTGDIQLTLSQQAPITGAVVVTTPQDVALSDVRRAISMFGTTKVPVLGVCETMSFFAVEGKEYYIFGKGGGEKIAKETGVPFLGGIPIDPEVCKGGDEGMPIVISHPESAAARAYKKVAGEIAARISTINMEKGENLETFSLAWKR